MSDNNNEDDMSFSAYGHLKKEVAEKQKKSKVAASNAGVPAVAKVFTLSIILFGGLLVSGVLTGDLFSSDPPGTGDPNFPGGGGEFPDSLHELCVNHEIAGLRHYHYNLEIRVDGVSQIIPRVGDGSNDGCMRAVHTHDQTGKIHIEVPSDYSGPSVTVNDFFIVWGETFTTSQLLDYSGDITMTVNGATIPTNPNYVPTTAVDSANEDLIVLSIVTST